MVPNKHNFEKDLFYETAQTGSHVFSRLFELADDSSQVNSLSNSHWLAD